MTITTIFRFFEVTFLRFHLRIFVFQNKVGIQWFSDFAVEIHTQTQLSKIFSVYGTIRPKTYKVGAPVDIKIKAFWPINLNIHTTGEHSAEQYNTDVNAGHEEKRSFNYLN